MQKIDPETRKIIKTVLISAIGLIICIGFYFLILRFRDFSKWFDYMMDVVKPFIYGAAIAYLLMPLTGRLERIMVKLFKGKRKNLSNAVAAFLALIFGLLIILAVIMLIIPQLIDSIAGLIKSLPTDLGKAQKFVSEVLNRQPVILEKIQEYIKDLQSNLTNILNTQVMPNIKNIGLSVVGGVASVVLVLKNLLLGFIIALYILLKRRQFAAQGKLILHSLLSDRSYRIVADEVKYADKMFNGFFMGKLKDSFIIGVICFICCLFLGYRSPILIAVIIGVTNIIPFFGPFIGAVPCALLLLLENPMHCLTFIIFIIILQTLDGNVIGPKILGDTTGLSSFWVLFSILFFGAIWGVLGMIVGVPFFAVVYDIIKKLVYRSLNKRKKTELIEDYNREFH